MNRAPDALLCVGHSHAKPLLAVRTVTFKPASRPFAPSTSAIFLTERTPVHANKQARYKRNPCPETRLALSNFLVASDASAHFPAGSEYLGTETKLSAGQSSSVRISVKIERTTTRADFMRYYAAHVITATKRTTIAIRIVVRHGYSSPERCVTNPMACPRTARFYLQRPACQTSTVHSDLASPTSSVCSIAKRFQGSHAGFGFRFRIVM